MHSRKFMIRICMVSAAAAVLLLCSSCGSRMDSTEDAMESKEAETAEAGQETGKEAETVEESDEAAEESDKAAEDQQDTPDEPLNDMNRELESFEQESENRYYCEFDSIRHDLIIDMPDDHEGKPLILMLHGYGQSAGVMRSNVHLEEKANPLGYTVVYVTGAVDPADKTSSTGWNAGNKDGSNKDVEFLCALAHRLQKEYGLDETRCYAAGFSNGAFMTQRLAMEAPQVFSAVVSVAGMMPEMIWEEKDIAEEVSVFQITGEKDDLVPKYSDGSAKYSINPAIEDVMDHWASVDGLTQKKEIETGSGSVLTEYFEEGKNRQVWHLFVKGGRHGWPNEQFNKIDANSFIMDFLNSIDTDQTDH